MKLPLLNIPNQSNLMPVFNNIRQFKFTSLIKPKAIATNIKVQKTSDAFPQRNNSIKIT